MVRWLPRRECQGCVVEPRLDGEGRRLVRLEVVDGDLVAHGAEDGVTVAAEQQVALPVDRPQQVAELVVELHLGSDTVSLQGHNQKSHQVTF